MKEKTFIQNKQKKISPSWIIWNISLSTTISQNGIFEFRNLTFFRNTDIGTWNIQTGFPLIFTIKGHILGYNTP